MPLRNGAERRNVAGENRRRRQKPGLMQRLGLVVMSRIANGRPLMGASGVCIIFCACGLTVAITVAGIDTLGEGWCKMTLDGCNVTVPVGRCNGAVVCPGCGGRGVMRDVSLLIMRHFSI